MRNAKYENENQPVTIIRNHNPVSKVEFLDRVWSPGFPQRNTKFGIGSPTNTKFGRYRDHILVAIYQIWSKIEFEERLNI